MTRELSTLELAGNVLCLDFANTLNSRRHQLKHDYLASYDDLVRWARYAGAVPPDAQIGGRASRRASAIEQAHRLRDAIYATFSAIADDRQPSTRGVTVISDAYREAMTHAAIARQDGGRFEVVWTTVDTPLWPVAYSAGELLLRGDLTRIGECPGCGWLFLDTSRNGTRRWCNMATCGSRDKMARYHRRNSQDSTRPVR